MSQRPPASRPASRSPPDGQRRITLPPVQLRDDLQQGGRSTERPQQELEGRGRARPALRSPQHARVPSAPGDDWRTPASSRDLGVHSMLNPSEPEGSAASNRRLSGETTESPLSVAGPPSRFGASPSTATTHSFSSQNVPSSTSPTAENNTGIFSREPRKMMTPKSPARAAARAVSSGRGSSLLFDPQRSPFLPARGRSYMAEPGPSSSSEVPPMPTPPGLQQQQQQYFPQSSSTPSMAARRPSGPMQAPGRTPLSQSASPSISVSSHGPASSQTSPASFVVHKSGPSTQTTSSYYPGSSFATSMQQGSGMQFPGPSGPAEGPYSALAPQTQGSSLQSSSTGSSRQTSASEPIQVLTITTSQGSYHVPVDVHQASRLADEKRARNAGASARFRQRRKEKEKEANSRIEKFQQQTRDLERKVKDLEQERDFYRMERDRFRDVLVRNPEMRHIAAQAPPSPQTRRSSSFQGMMGGPPPSRAHPPPLGFGSNDGPERAPIRRRTDTQGEFTSLTYGPPITSLPPVLPAGYPPPSGPSGLPPMRMDPNAPHSASSSLPTTTGPPPPSDPYSRGPYDRTWSGERR